MAFTSPTFLFLFLPVVLVAVWLSPRPLRYLLIAAGFVFYAWGAGGFVFVVLLSTLADWLLGLGIQRAPRGRHPQGARATARSPARPEPRAAHLLQVRGVPAQPADRHALGARLRGRHFSSDVLLPIGISFFTFHSISYVVDV